MAKFHAQIWQFWKSGHISETAACRAIISSILPPWGTQRLYVQLLQLWLMAKFLAQIWQFWKSAHISETAIRGAKISSISPTWGRKRVYVQLLALSQMAKFHAQMAWIGQFWKSARISETAPRRAKISTISPTWGKNRVYMYVQLLELWLMGRFYAQIWQFWKLARISETAARRVKSENKLNFVPKE